MVAHTHHVCDTRDCQRCTGPDGLPLPSGRDAGCYACDREADAWTPDLPPAQPAWQATGDNVDWLAVWETVFEEELEASDEAPPAGPVSRRRLSTQDMIRVRQRRKYCPGDDAWNLSAPGCMTFGPHNPVVKHPPPAPPGDLGDEPWNTFQRRYSGARANPEAKARFLADRKAGRDEANRLQRLGLVPRMRIGILDPSCHNPEGVGIFAVLTHGPDVPEQGPDESNLDNYTRFPETNPRAGRWVDWDAPYLAHLERWQRWHHRRTVYVRT